MKPQLSVIIPTFNRSEILRVSLGHLIKSSSDINIEVVVVNDGNESLEHLKEVYPTISIIKNEGSGVASARNFGVKNSTGEVIFFMDDDMWIPKEAIQRVLEFHALYDGKVLNLNWVYPKELMDSLTRTVFGRYLIHFGFTTLKGWSKDSVEWYDCAIFRADGVTSQNLSMKRSTFQLSGGYNESFPFAGFEDYDYSKRLSARSVEIFIDSNVTTYHNESDRTSIDSWLDRKFRGSITRKVAVTMGYTELSISYPFFKKMIYVGIGIAAARLRGIIQGGYLDRNSALDRLSFLIINALLAESIFRGYTFKTK